MTIPRDGYTSRVKSAVPQRTSDGRFFWLPLYRTGDGKKHWNPAAERARQFIAEWNRTVAVESLLWSETDLEQLVQLAQGKMDVSQCSFIDEFRADDDDAETCGSDAVSGSFEYRPELCGATAAG
jgi:hypothetical protein